MTANKPPINVITACRALTLLHTQNHGLSSTSHPNGFKIEEY